MATENDIATRPTPLAVDPAYDRAWFRDEAERKGAIGEALAGDSRTLRPLPILLGDCYEDCPTIRVPHQALIYRFDNGRLIAERDEALRAAGSRPEAADGEGVDAQAILHALLIGHASDPRGPILQELARFGRQVEPLIATRAGVVVNGNRRLAAMRALGRTEPDRLGSFSHVEIALLSAGITEAELEYLEASLQMAPDTKLAYGWANRRMKLREQRDVLKLPMARLLDAYRLPDSQQIELEIAELALAERYLKARRRVGDWADLEGGFALIEMLATQLRPLSQDRRATWEAIGFLLVAFRADRDPSAVFPFVKPVSGEIPKTGAERIARSAGLVDEDQPTEARLRAVLVPFAGGADAQTAGAIVEVMNALRLEHIEQAAPMRALNQLRQVGATLQRLEPDRLTPAQQRQLRSDLAALTAQANFLLGEMERPAKEGSWNRRKGMLEPPYRKILPRLLRRVRGR